MANPMDAIKGKSAADAIYGASKPEPKTKRPGVTEPAKPADDVTSMLQKILTARTLNEAQALAQECLDMNGAEESAEGEVVDEA